MRDGVRPTRCRVNLGILGDNVRFLRAKTPGTAALMAVVKADGYGHGALPVAKAALQNGATWLGVATPEEGAALRRAGIAAPILVLGGISPMEGDLVAAHGLTQAVFSPHGIAALSEAAAHHGRTVDVHIKADTGMGRVGVRTLFELAQAMEAIQAAPSLRLTGLFTHFAAADDTDLSCTNAQAERFEALLPYAKARCPGICCHAANSAALLRVPHFAYDMVRAGFALYAPPNLPKGGSQGLHHAMAWITRGVHLKEIAPGETVSYGRQFTAMRPTRVMTLPVGYGDGYHRAIGGRGHVLIAGRKAPVIGRVCMDQTMIDVTDIPDASLADEVVLLGSQGAFSITPREMGEWCGMIDYEILLSPTPRMGREYIP